MKFKSKKPKMVGGPGVNISADAQDTPDFVQSRRDLDKMRKEPMKIAQKVGKLAGVRLKKR